MTKTRNSPGSKVCKHLLLPAGFETTQIGHDGAEKWGPEEGGFPRQNGFFFFGVYFSISSASLKKRAIHQAQKFLNHFFYTLMSFATRTDQTERGAVHFSCRLGWFCMGNSLFVVTVLAPGSMN